MVALDGILYVVGGVVEGNRPNAVWSYDPVSDAWSADLAAIPTNREHLTAVAANGLVYAIGGRFGSNFEAVETYDPATDTWATAPPMPEARGGLTAGLIGSVIHVTGGEDFDAGRTQGEHFALDLVSGAWYRLPDMPSRRHGLASAVLDGRWYVIGGGRAPGVAVSDLVEVYAP